MPLPRIEKHNPRFRKITPPKKGKQGTVVPRPWQEACRSKLHRKRFTVISAPCGSGKSIAILLRCVDEIVRSGFQQKQLIVVPQKIIGQSFTEEIKVTAYDGREYTWMPAHNFIDYMQPRVVRDLKKWLRADWTDLCNPDPADPFKIEGINAVCSHQALALAWQQLATEALRNEAIHDLTISIDEAHHVCGVFDESDDDLTPEEKAEANHLGTVVHAIVNSKDKSACICLGTATFYRGDAAYILHKSVRDRFEAGTYIHSWIEHWEDPDGLNIKNFRMEYRFYKNDPAKQAVEQINSAHTWLMYVPGCGRAWRGRDEVDGLTPALDKLFRTLYAKVPKGEVLDLVTKGTQNANLRRFHRELRALRNGAKPSFRIIVACGIGLEGMDYPPADRLLNLGVQNSITRAVQVVGRPLRRYYAKVDVHVYNYIDEYVKLGPKTTLGDLLAKRSGAIFTCMAWDDLLNPLMVELPLVEGPTQPKELPEAVGHEYLAILKDICIAVESETVKSLAVIEAIAKAALAAEGVTEPAIIKGMVAKVVRALLMNSPDPKAQELSVFFDVSMLLKAGILTMQTYNLENGTIFFGDCTAKELRGVRDFIKSNWEEMLRAWAERQKKGKAA